MPVSSLVLIGVDLAADKARGRPRVALAAGRHQMRGMDHRVRIVRAQDPVVAVATRAIRRRGRAARAAKP